MLLFTNPGSNLPRAAIERYGVVLMPQQIVASGTSHDTRQPIPLTRVDEWTAVNGEYPYVVGTTAPEATAMFVEHLARDPEILVITTSRKIIKTYDACLAAAQTVRSRPKFANARIEIVDSEVTDVGAGLLVMLAGEAIRAGKHLDEVVRILERAKLSLRLYGYIHDLDQSVRGGRVGWIRAWLANALELRPLLVFRDGEASEGGRVKLSSDRMGALAVASTKGLEGKKIWLAVAHGASPRDAEEVARGVAARCEVVFSIMLPMSPSIYLHGGPGCVMVGAFTAPEDVPAPPPVTVESSRFRVAR